MKDVPRTCECPYLASKSTPWYGKHNPSEEVFSALLDLVLMQYDKIEDVQEADRTIDADCFDNIVRGISISDIAQRLNEILSDFEHEQVGTSTIKPWVKGLDLSYKTGRQNRQYLNPDDLSFKPRFLQYLNLYRPEYSVRFSLNVDAADDGGDTHSNILTDLKGCVWFRHPVKCDMVAQWIREAKYGQNREKLPLLIITGPTASGKSELLRFISRTLQDSVYLSAFSKGSIERYRDKNLALCIDEAQDMFDENPRLSEIDFPRPCAIVVKGPIPEALLRDSVVISMMRATSGLLEMYGNDPEDVF